MPELEPLPYYKWHWLRWRASRKVQRQSLLERGIYHELLDEQWAEGCIYETSLPEILGNSKQVLASAKQVLTMCFSEISPGVWQNSTLEEQRTENDKIRSKRKIAGKLGAEAKIESLASAKQVLASAGKCHIEEKRREEKRSTLSSLDSTEKSEKREKREKPTDPRRKEFIDDLKGHWDAMNHGSPEFAMDAADGNQIRLFLSKWKDLAREDWRKALKNRRMSSNVISTEAIHRWLPRLLEYANGPLNQFGRVEATTTPEKPRTWAPVTEMPRGAQ